jgi:hypothetical protein
VTAWAGLTNKFDNDNVFLYMLIMLHLGNEILYMKTTKTKLYVAFVIRHKEYLSIPGMGLLHAHFRVSVMLIIEDPSVTEI